MEYLPIWLYFVAVMLGFAAGMLTMYFILSPRLLRGGHDEGYALYEANKDVIRRREEYLANGGSPDDPDYPRFEDPREAKLKML